jgi:hypothetical protein
MHLHLNTLVYNLAFFQILLIQQIARNIIVSSAIIHISVE